MRRKLRAGAWVLVVVGAGALVWACSSNETTDAGADAGMGLDAGKDAPAPKDAAKDTGDTDSGACNALMQLAQQMLEQRIAVAAPTPKGGTIPNGTYIVTKAVAYTGDGGQTGPSGNAIQATVVTSNGTFQAAVNAAPDHQSGTFAIDGSAFSSTITCPTTAMPYIWAYFENDLDAGTVTLFGSFDASVVQAIVMTKQ